MKFYLIRHGQTDWNIEGKIQGKTDIPLNSEGLYQAERLAEGMKERRITAIFSSPLLRAFQTAELLSQEKNLPVTVLPELREVDFGLWEGKGWDEVDALYHEDFRNWEEYPGEYMPTGGESRESCSERCRKAVDLMAGEEAAAVVAHGGILAHVVRYLLRKQDGEKEIIVKNASISVIEYDPVLGTGELLFLNDTDHLGKSKVGKTNKFC